MSNSLLTFIENEGAILVKDVESGAETAFNHMKTEAAAAYAWLKAEVQSPEVQSFLAKALADAETAAAALVSSYGAAVQPAIQSAVADSETFIANLLNSALGGNVKTNLTTIPAAQDGVAQLGSAAGLIAQQAFGTVVSKLLAGAA
jgi:hypothetical protein